VWQFFIPLLFQTVMIEPSCCRHSPFSLQQNLCACQVGSMAEKTRQLHADLGQTKNFFQAE
jgi:hypothetical protein